MPLDAGLDAAPQGGSDDGTDDLEPLDAASLLTVANPAYDYVEPTLVSLFLTNIGGHNPSYIYRLLAEIYNPSDYNFDPPAPRL